MTAESKRKLAEVLEHAETGEPIYHDWEQFQSANAKAIG